jgi:hypothetical protein
MTEEKDIRFVEKKVDESWKDQASRDKESFQKPAGQASPKETRTNKTSQPFLGLITSLGYQAMIQLGELPESGQTEVNLPAAQEIIELLLAIKTKSEGNLSPEESQLLTSLIPDLQLKFAQKS